MLNFLIPIWIIGWTVLIDGFMLVTLYRRKILHLLLQERLPTIGISLILLITMIMIIGVITLSLTGGRNGAMKNMLFSITSFLALAFSSIVPSTYVGKNPLSTDHIHFPQKFMVFMLGISI